MVVQVAVLPVFGPREERSLRRTIAFALIRDHPPRHIVVALEELAEARLGRVRVPSALHQDIQHIPILIPRSPEVVAFAIDREENFIEMPRVTRLRASASERIGRGLADFPAPLADRLIGDDDPAGEQRFFDIAIAEAEPAIEPDRVADDLDREAVVLIAVT